MTAPAQRRLAILGALLLAGLFVAANIHLLGVALTSRSACVPAAPDKPPAKRVC
ncbi:hypothetical protein [Frigidibacter sp. ROC022]|uniref:hypothetical protein n=1 Tax=Frigidibacter sp. ROC022 TaxID=2971796 RepID=UPI00215AFD10|nr:hypothetical protein [Frigidibacter sp. ROC022]MCR8723893.1 hypothetical protein [Frigidibacter sp. ROC022]